MPEVQATKRGEIFTIKQGDNSPSIAYYLGLPDDVSLEGASARFILQDPETKEIIVNQPAVVDASDRRLIYHWQAGETDTPGVWRAEFPLTFSGGQRETQPNEGFLEVRIGESTEAPPA